MTVGPLVIWWARSDLAGLKCELSCNARTMIVNMGSFLVKRFCET